MEKIELQELIDGCLRNQRKHQEKLYKTYYGFAYGIALRYARDRDEASIILNKGFYNVFVSLNNYNGTIAFNEWLRNFIVQASVKHYLDKLKFPTLIPESKTGNIHFKSDGFEKDLSPGDKIKMLHRLSDLDRIVFNLFAIEGYSHEKIASLMDISVSTSVEILTNARQTLRSFMSNL